MSPQLTIHVPDGSFGCYVVYPSAASPATAKPAPAPVIVVIQEIFGVNAGIRSIADGYAAQGYIAVCPDLFWRAEPGLAMSESSAGDWARGFALYSAYDLERGVADIAATVAAARRLDGASGKVGVTGYCLGGLLTFLAAANPATGADAFVAYYGGATEKYVDRAPLIQRPLLYHLAGEDEYIGKDAQAVIHAALDQRAQLELHDYPGRNHAFARPGGTHFHAADAALANRRSEAFFQRHLA